MPQIKPENKPRIVVCTDISSLEPGYQEPDDTQSLVRLVLYSCDVDIEGLVATKCNHPKVHTDYIEHIVRQYGAVRENLLRHNPDYPTMEQLLGVIKAGTVNAGVEHVGHDTQGSDWIISVVDKDDPRPVWVIMWGGPHELAQALWRVRSDRSPEEVKAFVSKVRVYAISDQDSTGPWIKEEFPDLFYITSAGKRAFRGMYKGGDVSLCTSEWIWENLKGHGPLGDAYVDYKGGDTFAGPVHGLKEGDSPSYLYLVPNGLSAPEHPEWGGWGGRFVPSDNPNQFDDAEDTSVDAEHPDWATVHRWRPDFQADFAARMDWCKAEPPQLNHEPLVVLDGERERTVKPGESVSLSVTASDPDGGTLSYEWFVYEDASSVVPALEHADTAKVKVVVPKAAEGIAHVIVRARNDGVPALCRYARVALHVIA